ncbi:MAG: zinc-ribbon domain-containing protein [Deltaproteobacteria bacterium]|nr:MAG: zinc-ribbon domain-containing protein [Deltaproteobacteria bacterium]
MNCPTCGAQNLPNAAFCSQCSTNLMAPPGMPPGAPMPGAPMGYGPMGYGGPPMMTRTSGMAIAGFVLSFFCGLLGLIFSIIGYNECKKSMGGVTGDGLAIAGIIISILNCIGWISWFVLVASAASAAHGRF